MDITKKMPGKSLPRHNSLPIAYIYFTAVP